LKHHGNPANPFLTVDVIIEYNPGILLVKRKNPPEGWELPEHIAFDHRKILDDYFTGRY